MPSGIYKRTEQHKRTFFKKGHSAWNKGTIGIVKSWNKGTKGLTHSNKTSFQKGFIPWNKNKKLSKEHIDKLKEKWIGRKHILTEKGKKSFTEKMSKENNPKWIKDRTKLKKSEKKHLNYQYQIWMKEVKNRDNWKCRLSNGDCKGRLESHHIFNWIDYPELRYVITNGITLCRFHHPIKWEEEKRMIPIFQELLSVSKE